jgi:chemotaxis-related protein WspD
MNSPPDIHCWRQIGTSGDRSCPELKTHVHCRNCPIFSAGAARLLDVDVSENYLAEQGRRFAERKTLLRPGATSAVIFRLGVEWLAQSTRVLSEVAPVRSVH